MTVELEEERVLVQEEGLGVRGMTIRCGRGEGMGWTWIGVPSFEEGGQTTCPREWIQPVGDPSTGGQTSGGEDLPEGEATGWNGWVG